MRRSQFSKSGYVSAGISLTSLQHLPEDPIQSPTIQNTLKRQRKMQYAQLHMDSSATSPSAAHQLESSPCKQTQIQRPKLCRACFEIHNLLCVHIQSKSCEDRLAKGIRCRYSWNREIENWNESSPDIADISNPKSKRSVAWSMPNW